jgi:hypothetical protein
MPDWDLGWQWDWEWVALFPLAIAMWVVPMWRIIGRTGRHPALALLAIVPFTALLMLWWLAFVDWPVRHQAGRPAS